MSGLMASAAFGYPEPFEVLGRILSIQLVLWFSQMHVWEIINSNNI